VLVGESLQVVVYLKVHRIEVSFDSKEKRKEREMKTNHPAASPSPEATSSSASNPLLLPASPCKDHPRSMGPSKKREGLIGSEFVSLLAERRKEGRKEEERNQLRPSELNTATRGTNELFLSSIQLSLISLKSSSVLGSDGLRDGRKLDFHLRDLRRKGER